MDENTAESEKNYVRNGPNKSESSLTLKNLAPDLESLLVVWGIAAASDWLRRGKPLARLFNLGRIPGIVRVGGIVWGTVSAKIPGFYPGFTTWVEFQPHTISPGIIPRFKNSVDDSRISKLPYIPRNE